MKKNSIIGERVPFEITPEVKRLLIAERLCRIGALLMLVSMAGTVLWTWLTGTGGTLLTFIPTLVFFSEFVEAHRIHKALKQLY